VPGGVNYPGLIGPEGNVNVFPPGTLLNGATLPNPIFTAPAAPFPMNGFVVNPDGSTTYNGFPARTDLFFPPLARIRRHREGGSGGTAGGF